MTETEVRQKFVAWASSELGLTLIKSNQPDSPPDKPYATITMLSEVSLGQRDEMRDINDLGVADFVGFRDATISLQFYDDVNSGSGKTAFQFAQEAVRSLNKRTILDGFFFVDDIAIRQVLPINNTELFLDSINEQRAQFDVLIGYIDEFTDEVGFIETVEMESDLDPDVGEDLTVDIS